MVTAKHAARSLCSKRSKRRRSLTKISLGFGSRVRFCIDYGAPAKWRAATSAISSSLILSGPWSQLASAKACGEE